MTPLLAQIEAALRAVPELCECGKPIEGPTYNWADHRGCVESGWPDYPAQALAVAGVVEREQKTLEADVHELADKIQVAHDKELQTLRTERDALAARVRRVEEAHRDKRDGCGARCDLCEEVVTSWEWVDKGWSLACSVCLAKIRNVTLTPEAGA